MFRRKGSDVENSIFGHDVPHQKLNLRAGTELDSNVIDILRDKNVLDVNHSPLEDNKPDIDTSESVSSLADRVPSLESWNDTCAAKLNLLMGNPYWKGSI